MATEVEFQPKKQRSGVSGKLADTKDYIWNSEKGEFLGRSGMSWLKITVFYMIYYSCLAGFWAVCLVIFFTTIDANAPLRTGKESLIKGYPGMGFRPMPDLEYTLIRFEQGNPSSYKIHTDHIQAFLDQYENKAQVSENFMDCTHGGRSEEDKDKICRFNIEQLGPECTWQKDFGYDEGQPCVLLKLNKIYDWEPESYDNDTIPENIKGQYNQGDVYVTCEGENPADVENIGEIEIWPKSGFLGYYFPYRNQQGYRAPVVMVKFKKPHNGLLIQVWCKAWAKNIYHDKNDRAGSTHFELLVD